MNAIGLLFFSNSVILPLALSISKCVLIRIFNLRLKKGLCLASKKISVLMKAKCEKSAMEKTTQSCHVT